MDKAFLYDKSNNMHKLKNISGKQLNYLDVSLQDGAILPKPLPNFDKTYFYPFRALLTFTSPNLT